MNEYAEEFKIDVDANLKDLLGKHTEKPLENFKNSKNEHLFSEEVADLIARMLTYNHKERITAREAMEHEFFSSRS